jgi:hypothetical protein
MKRISSIFFVLALFFSASKFNFAQVTLTLPNITGNTGTEILAPITVNNMTGLNISSYQFQINYNPAVIKITDLSIVGTMSAGGSASKFVDTLTGIFRALWARSGNQDGTPNPLVGSGTLLNIKLKYKANGSTAITYGATGSFVNEFGSGSITITAVNGTATTSSVNSPPVFDAVPAKTVNEGALLSFTVNATDPEGLPVTYTTGTLPTGANFNPTTKTFTWTPAAGQAGTYTVEFRATDGNSTTSLSVSITVVKVNQAPSLLLNPPGPYTIPIGQALQITLQGADPDAGTTLTYSYSSSPTITGATINVSAGVYSWSWTPTAGQIGSYNVVFTVSDGSLSTNANTVITVIQANRAPVLNLNLTAPVNVDEGQNFVYQLTATDPDAGAVLTFSSNDKPAGSVLNSQTGLFTWTPSFTQAGTYNFSFTVKDEFNASDSKPITIIVGNVNRAPAFVNKMPNQMVTVHNVPVEFQYQYSASDPDGDLITFSLLQNPAGSTITSVGLFKWTPTTDQANSQFTVSVMISDGGLAAINNTTLTTSTIVSVADNESLPKDYKLLQNYPNPFNPSTTIEFALAKESYVVLNVYNILGEEAANILKGYKSAGYHRINFDAKNLQSGTYFYQMKADNFIATRKMIVLK